MTYLDSDQYPQARAAFNTGLPAQSVLDNARVEVSQEESVLFAEKTLGIGGIREQAGLAAGAMVNKHRASS